METEIFKIEKAEIKDYIEALKDFDKEINSNYQKAKQKILVKDNGYLIDKKCFDNFKEKLNYKKFKSIQEDAFNEKIDEIFKDNIEIKYIPFEPKIFNTSKELIDSLSKNNEYIIINSKIFEIINKKKEEKKGKISYEIKENELIINLGPGDKSVFKHNFNIIKYNILLSRTGINAQNNPENKISQDKFNRNNKAPNLENNGKDTPIKLFNNIMNSDENLINRLYLSIIEYNNFENLLINKFRQNKNDIDEIMQGYFIDNSWIQKWKTNTDYENNRFLLSENINEENIKKIKESIKINSKSTLKEISIIKYFNEKNFNSIYNNHIITLVSEKFLNIFVKEIKGCKRYEIKFRIINHKFFFFQEKYEKYSLYSFNNTIPIETNEYFKIINKLIELYISQEQIKLKIEKGNTTEKENLALIDKKWMNNFKNKYSYNKLCDLIKDIKIIKEKINKLEKIKIEKENINFVLNDIIKEFDWGYFYIIYNKNHCIQDDNENYDLNYQEFKLNDANKKIKYIDNF